jgi:apolipoprotein D and lipocalin family protein
MSPLARLLAASVVVVAGCASPPANPIPTVRNVNLDRFMGDWYVIAHIPASLEKDAHNAVESYRLEPDGTIATTYTFYDGGFEGDARRYTPKGFVRDPVNNSTWGMQFLWPIRAEYLIAHLDADYTRTIVARNARDLVWIMARTPTIPEDEYARLVALVAGWGYDVSGLRRVPQRW